MTNLSPENYQLKWENYSGQTGLWKKFDDTMSKYYQAYRVDGKVAKKSWNNGYKCVGPTMRNLTFGIDNLPNPDIKYVWAKDLPRYEGISNKDCANLCYNALEKVKFTSQYGLCCNFIQSRKPNVCSLHIGTEIQSDFNSTSIINIDGFLMKWDKQKEPQNMLSFKTPVECKEMYKNALDKSGYPTEQGSHPNITDWDIITNELWKDEHYRRRTQLSSIK